MGHPFFLAVTANGKPGIGEVRRAMEIVNWVRAHPHACASGWVALDDLDLLSVAPPPTGQPIMPPNHFVRTNPSAGLTARMQSAWVGPGLCAARGARGGLSRRWRVAAGRQRAEGGRVPGQSGRSLGYEALRMHDARCGARQ